MSTLMNFLKRRPAHLDGYCVTADELLAYWAVTPDATARRVAGLRFLGTVGNQLLSNMEYVSRENARYPNMLYSVNGEVAKVEAEIMKLVGPDTHLFADAFRDNLALGRLNQQRFFHTATTDFVNELTIERMATIWNFFGEFLRPTQMRHAVQFILLTMKRTTAFYISEPSKICWERQFELAKLFAAKRPQGPLTRAELQRLADSLDALNRDSTDQTLQDELSERIRQIEAILQPELKSAA